MPEVIVILGGHVFLGDYQVHEDLAVEITDGVITYINNRLTYTPPPWAKVIDARQKTVMPGIVDAHVTGTENVPPNFSGNGIRTQFVMDGVTTTCNVGSSIEGMASLQEGPWRNGVAIGRSFSSGTQLVPAVPAGLPEETAKAYAAVSTEFEINEAIYDSLLGGADYVKISVDPVLDLHDSGTTTQPFQSTQVDAIVGTAATLGLHTRASVLDEPWVSRAVGKPIHVIDYTPRLDSVDPALRKDNADPYVFAHIYEDESIEQYIEGPRQDIYEIAARGAVIVPMLAFMDQKYPWKRPANVAQGGVERSMYEEVVGWYHDLGGLVAYGSAYEPGRPVGVYMPEVLAMKAAGLSALEIVTAMTGVSALACGALQDFGILELGARGDVIVLDGDVRVDITALDRVTHVVLDGKLAKGEFETE